MYIKCGRTQLLRELLVGFTLEEAAKNFPHTQKEVIAKCWKIANPKGVKKAEETKEGDK